MQSCDVFCMPRLWSKLWLPLMLLLAKRGAAPEKQLMSLPLLLLLLSAVPVQLL
jgi:hypothetical protein